MQWEYEMPLRIIYPKKPAKVLIKFTAGIEEILHSRSWQENAIMEQLKGQNLIDCSE